MPAGAQSHQEAAQQHQAAAALHLQAAAAHKAAASANLQAGSPDAADSDLAAAKQHAKAAAKNSAAASAHTIAAAQSTPQTKTTQKSAQESQGAAAQSQSALDSSQNAASDDQTAVQQSQGTPKATAAANAATAGQTALHTAQQAAGTGAQAATQGQAAAEPSITPGGWYNGLIESIGATGMIKTMLDHNRFLTLSLIGVVIVIIFFYGDEPKAQDPFNSCGCKGAGQSVTEAELTSELNSYVAAKTNYINAINADLKVKGQQVENADAQVAQQEQLIATALNAVSSLAVASAPVTGPIGPLIGIATGLITTGLLGDNVRKQSVASKAASAAGTDPGNT